MLKINKKKIIKTKFFLNEEELKSKVRKMRNKSRKVLKRYEKERMRSSKNEKPTIANYNKRTRETIKKKKIVGH